MDKQNRDRVTFLQLSVPLKIAIIFAYIVGIIYCFFFIVGTYVAVTEGFI